MATQERRADRVLQLPEVVGASCLAGYVALPGEPDPALVVTRLLAQGVTIAYPRLRADGDLDFVAPGSGTLVAGLRGTREPADGTVVPIDEIDVLLIPAVAGDLAGHRLGRGGGAYDRALPRIRPDALVVALLHDDEVLPAVPFEAHDVLVDVLVTEERTLRTGARRS
jgi:5-formyltetrahydrofolate cyclo-ligase